MADYLTEKFPGTGGTIKECPEDFRVEEIPLYEPCGEGEHLYLDIEKSGLTTFDLLDTLAKALGAKRQEMGYAGLKDARAVTRQTISMTGVRPEQAMDLQLDGITILDARYHRNKLRTGHLKGNRFIIRVRDVVSQALERAQETLHVLQMTGVPNYFGEQRYGVLGNNHLVGKAILNEDFSAAISQIIGDPTAIRNADWQRAAETYIKGDIETARRLLPRGMGNESRLLGQLAKGCSPQKALLGMPHKLLRLYLSAYQSCLFDRIVTMRLDSLETLWPGDLAYKHDNGACFLVTDPAEEQPRADRLEISPSAPLYGYKGTLSQGQAGILEESLLAKEGLTRDSFRLVRGLSLEGARRPLRVPLGEVTATAENDHLLLAFSLPKGSYATSVLREVIKTA
ncbi:MAG: tRNA pseudouridine(13) synthase TruD [Desulfuromonadales bacterium C00003096]|jgi:tRNA pseudouridine13 synthase|nr:MAG: tRNA pseudouridine(13) synthase TruD [Desulfuromonadales bacterium C00003096]